ncbi:MAG TPA: shikimate kinase [Methylomirabilota bacterium]|nr:shikimate kinase [Methylomirabilota bacterium]
MSGPRQIHNIALIGFMGTGKTATGRLVAAQLRFEFVDTDELIERRAGKTITRVFAEDGEPAFREMERQVVAELASRRHVVIATGGGLGANPANLASLKTHALVVCLWATPEGIWRRVNGQSHRPLLSGPDPMARIRALLAERTPVYRQADVLVNAEHRSVREVAQHVIHEFHLARQRPASREKPHPTARP